MFAFAAAVQYSTEESKLVCSSQLFVSRWIGQVQMFESWWNIIPDNFIILLSNSKNIQMMATTDSA